ncbi:IS21-like element helper ATPase IstB [Tellurirhabdus rosea]|uniref:IS21-like element helper ATPase IstB n=1 Tax=Tellurirhabdus rosea TaxID=2674997 RepID=UPI00224E6807|nr:IS21-like element helper ATPase IstB [Tellurirhabdus rosea]
MEHLKDKLKSLRLPWMAQALALRNEYALANSVSYLAFLELLIEDETAQRQANAYQKRLMASHINVQKTLDNYDFSYQPGVDKKLMYDLGTGRFIRQKENVLLLGKPGVGKTHLAQALGHQALKLGYRVLFIHANELIERLQTARGDGSYRLALQKLLQPELLIIDEIGFKKLPVAGLDDFFEVIRSRYEQGSIIVTTNRNFEDWGALLGDTVMASAIIDRLVHHATVIRITGNSYRVKSLLREEVPAVEPGLNGQTHP